MKKYIGTKQIEAQPMTMGEAYEKGLLQAGRVPNEQEKYAQGYHVRYKDGYESWSPAGPFEKAYRLADDFLDRLHIELEDLTEKQEKLNKFFETDKFKQLWIGEKQLLRAQFGTMLAYSQIHMERIRQASETCCDCESPSTTL